MMHSPSLNSALPHSIIQERSTYIDFAENQLFPSLISLSPLSSNHPSILQHTRVRSFTVCYHNSLNLFKLRSLGFGFANVNYYCLLLLGLPSLKHLFQLAYTVNSLTHYTKGKPSHLLLRLLYATSFKSFPSQYLFTIGKKEKFRL